jgi:hypothetical protein
MGGVRPAARRVSLVRGLGAVAVWWDAVVDRSEVRVFVRAPTERRDDVVNSVGSGLLADVTDASVAPPYLRAKTLPVRWQRGASVSGHAWIVPQGGAVQYGKLSQTDDTRRSLARNDVNGNERLAALPRRVAARVSCRGPPVGS